MSKVILFLVWGLTILDVEPGVKKGLKFSFEKCSEAGACRLSKHGQMERKGRNRLVNQNMHKDRKREKREPKAGRKTSGIKNHSSV